MSAAGVPERGDSLRHPDLSQGEGTQPTTHSARQSKDITGDRVPPEPPDGDAGIRAVLHADDRALSRLMRADVMLRKALVSQPTSANVEAARTLLAAGRVEQRKRQAERAAGMVAEWVAAKGAA